MIKAFLLSFLAFCFYTGQGQYPGYVLLNQTESFKKALAEATAGTETIQSDFTQEKSLSLLSEKIRSSGKCWFQKKDRLRMEYFHPFSYLMILRGGKIYIRDAQKENKISANSNKVFQQVNRILIDCVSGHMLENTDFQSRVFESGSGFMIELKPVAKNLSALYKNINIVIDKKDYSVTAVDMVEISGDNTLIRFQNKIINAIIPDSVFTIP